MSNNDNVNVSRDTLSEMDKIFIPEDLDDNVSLEDLATYKSAGVKCFRTVPENYCLVTKNIFTQKVTAISGFGVKFFAPLFTKTILVPLMDTTKNYNKVAVTSKDGIELKVDLGLVMRITEPAKYVISGKYQLSQLNSLVGRLLTIYTASKSYDQMISGNCSLHRFDPSDEFGRFEDEYGITIDKVIIEKVELPEKIKQQYNDKAEEKEKRIAQGIRLEAMKEKAIAEAEIRGIEAKAKAGEIKAIEEAKNQAYIEKLFGVLEKMKAQGLSTGFLENYINTLTMAETGNTIFMNGSNNSMASDIASGIVAGTKAVKNSNSDSNSRPMTNIDKLIYRVRDFDKDKSSDDDEYYNSIYQKFASVPETVQKVNGLSEEEFEKLVNVLLRERETNRSNTNNNGNGRGRK